MFLKMRDATYAGELAKLKRLRVKGKRVPDWYVVDNKEKLIVRCKKCKKEQLNSVKMRFAELLEQDKI